MALHLINPGRPHRFGKTRSEHEYNIRREWGSKTLDDDQLSRCKHLEKKVGKVYFDQKEIHSVRSKYPNAIEKRQIEAKQEEIKKGKKIRCLSCKIGRK